MNPYAIIKTGGKQLWVKENCYYDINRLHLYPNTHLSFNKILLINLNGSIPWVGQPFLDKIRVKFHPKSGAVKFEQFEVNGTVIRHLTGRKIHVYKMRPKKKTRKMFGFRAKLTRVYINAITVNSWVLGFLELYFFASFYNKRSCIRNVFVDSATLLLLLIKLRIQDDIHFNRFLH